MEIPLNDQLINQIKNAQFYMLRYETEFTPCTGITAVTKQERRHFTGGIMLAPWCPKIKENKAVDDLIRGGKVKYTDWKFKVHGRTCRVLTTTDGFTPILYLEVEKCFRGVADPYDVPLPTLHEDTLYFGLAVNELLKQIATPDQFVWGADWESVPALSLVRERHLIALTLHNTFDECLENESQGFGEVYQIFSSKRGKSEWTKTALEIGLEIADVATTVNRGFAYGMLHEPIQTRVMANHLQSLLGKVVGIDNAAFSDLNPFSKQFIEKYHSDTAESNKFLFTGQSEARAKLPAGISKNAAEKVIVVSMGRRVSQKLHDVLIESTRQILTRDADFPLFVVFATKRGDAASEMRLTRIKQLQKDFPANIAWTDGQLEFYGTLMQAADYNCMPSLYEPHGGAYEGTVIPIARAIDGLAEQICGLNPKGEAAKMNRLWHKKNDPPTGFLFREPPASDPEQLTADLKDLLGANPSTETALFKLMQNALSEVLVEAVRLRVDQPERYAAMVVAAIEKQKSTSWEENLNGMLALIAKARKKRKIG